MIFSLFCFRLRETDCILWDFMEVFNNPHMVFHNMEIQSLIAIARMSI